ncbi:sporulation histidine kinase inhibitor Sda [Salipaludibacillus sp. HK11]|uniref:sporulation histidine kinase inhibitor Sda n=1 Tax=Salipaludibacillus sp. HK11 TaxID=3394320 RepID=UPI0039FD0140
MMSSTINTLQDNQLIEIYHSAKELELDLDFIKILEAELDKRGISKERYSFS